jgi:hypothetical protein
MSRRLAVGLVFLGALVTGAVLGLVLIAPSGSAPGTATPAPPATAPTPATTSTSDVPEAGDAAAVSVLAKAIVDAISRHDSGAFGKLTCRPQTAEALAALQKTWDAAGPVTATLAEPPGLRGESATANVHVVGAGGTKDTPFPLHKENGRWCVPG